MIELLDKVIAHNSSVEVIKLFLEQEKQTEFNKALIEFRAECPQIEKLDQGQNLIGEYYDYAKLEHIQSKIDPVMYKHGLFYKFNQKQRGNMVTVQCLVSHVSGHKESTTMSATIQHTDALVSEQQTATTTSYLKRYTLVNALGLVVKGQDSDCNKAPERFDFNQTKLTGGAKGLREAVEATEAARACRASGAAWFEGFTKGEAKSTPIEHNHTIKAGGDARKLPKDAFIYDVPYSGEITAPKGMKFSHFIAHTGNELLRDSCVAKAVFVPADEKAEPKMTTNQGSVNGHQIKTEAEQDLIIKNGDKEIESLVSELEKGWQEKKASMYELAMSLEEDKQEQFLEAVAKLGESVLIHDVSQVAGFAKLIISSDGKVNTYVSETIGEVCEDWELNEFTLDREE